MVEQIIKLLQEHEKALGRYLEEKPEDWINNLYANIGRRPPSYLADRNAISIGTEIFKHTNDVAVVIATCRTAKGTFRGVGVASEKDRSAEPDILDLAQTRAITRALRLAGYYVKCCSAEEVLLLKDRKNTQTRRGHDPKPKRNLKSIIKEGAGGI
jgi:hypothetical protein